MDITAIKFKPQQDVPVAIAYAVASSIIHTLRAHGEHTNSTFVQDDCYKAINAMRDFIVEEAQYLTPLFKMLVAPITECELATGLTFGEAHALTMQGHSIARSGWNGRGIFVSRQVPDIHSKMTSPYLYIDTTGLQTDNTLAPKNLVPWAPSQTDLEACDWKVVTTGQEQI